MQVLVNDSRNVLENSQIVESLQSKLGKDAVFTDKNLLLDESIKIHSAWIGAVLVTFDKRDLQDTSRLKVAKSIKDKPVIAVFNEKAADNNDIRKLRKELQGRLIDAFNIAVKDEEEALLMKLEILSSPPKEIQKIGNLTLYPDAREIKSPTQTVHLSPQQFQLLACFANNFNRVMLRSDIVNFLYARKDLANPAHQMGVILSNLKNILPEDCGFTILGKGSGIPDKWILSTQPQHKDFECYVRAQKEDIIKRYNIKPHQSGVIKTGNHKLLYAPDLFFHTAIPAIINDNFLHALPISEYKIIKNIVLSGVHYYAFETAKKFNVFSAQKATLLEKLGAHKLGAYKDVVQSFGEPGQWQGRCVLNLEAINGAQPQEKSKPKILSL